MTAPRRKPSNPFESMLSEIVAEGMQRSKIEMDIIQFSREILGIELWPTQRAILKALYNLPLERGQWKDLFDGTPEEVANKCHTFDVSPDEWWDEREILTQWSLEGKTSWVEGAEYSELCLECGMRGTKTSTTSVIVTYEFFRLLQYDDPASHFGLMPGSLIAFLVLATSEDQAQDTLFAAIRGRIEHSAYFQGLITQGKLKVNTLDIEYPEKNLKLWAGHSRSAGLVGRTLMVFAMDEGNRFGVEGQGGATGIEMYANVGKGTTTLARFGAKKIVISSAWCEGDITDVLFEQATEGDSKHILAFKLATWDINPIFAKLKEKHPVIKAEYETRGVEAMRDYAGIRPGAEERFFAKDTIKRCMVGSAPVRYEPYPRTVRNEKDGTERTYSAVRIYVPEGYTLPDGSFSFGHCDPGLKRDSFGFVSGYPRWDPEKNQVIVHINALIEWQPIDKGKGKLYLVDYENVDEQLLELSPKILLKRLTFDHWNCYAVGSRISTPDGLRLVEDLLVGDPVVGQNGVNTVVAKEVVAQQPVVTVKTKFGYDATVTPHHPFWVIGKGWVHAKDLQLGDRIQIDDGKNVFGVEHDPLKALVYGYLIAEGDWSEGISTLARTGKPQVVKQVRFSNTEPQVQHDYAAAFEAVFGVEPKISKKTVRCGYDFVYDQIVAEVETGAHRKRIPEFVMAGTPETVGMFLAGLFEGDGNVRLNPKVLSVELNTVSEQLSVEVQLLLQRLGIKSSRKYFTNKWFKGKQCPFYRITIYGENIRTFLHKVGFRSDRKRLALEKAVEMLPTSRRSRSQDPWSVVVSVEPGTADIVHLEVSGDHTYVGQGLVGHNSAMMIQRLYSKGVSTEEFKSSFSQTVQREIYTVLREWMNAERVILPAADDSPAAARLYKELSELLLVNGRQIKHPPKGSKDMADALACVVWKIAQDERRFRYHEIGKDKIRPLGEIHSAKAIDDLFADEKIMHQRNLLRDPRRNAIVSPVMTRLTRVTQSDW